MPSHIPSPTPSSARWLLTTHQADADRVFFTQEAHDGLTTWTPMHRSGPASDKWTLKVFDAPEPGLFRIYTVQQGAVINCGGSNLSFSALANTHAHTPVTATA